MGQLSENMRFLAQEDDKYFIDRSFGILHALDIKLAPYAETLLNELKKPYKIKNKPILFIPVSHYLIFGEDQERKIENDITDILDLKYTSDSMLAIGETVNGEYSKANRKKQVTETLQKLSNLGVLPKAAISQQSQLVDRFNGFEKAIFKFSEEKSIQLEGVESLEGAIIATALESKLAFTHNDDDGAFRNEIKHRIGIEGRTRLALKRANQRASDASSVIFFQGAFHLEGVKGWCQRHSVDLKVIVPSSIKSKFKGKNSSLEFVD